MKNDTLDRKTEDSIRRGIRSELWPQEKPAPAAAGAGRFTYTVTADDTDMTVKSVLKKHLGFSRRLLTKLKQGSGSVTRNGVEVRLFAGVLEGDVIEAVLPEETCGFPPEDIPIDVVYEDEDMLVINKQPWVVVHPTRGHPSGTIANGLMKRMNDTGVRYKIRFVNRLDRDTSGLMIIGKNSHCQDIMTRLMKSDKVIKRYIAVVHGVISEESGTIDLPTGRLHPDDIKRCVMENGHPSVTHYRVLERFSGFTLIELRLETGRTHQIRVHMSYTGHPLVGDPLYGREEPGLIARQALHAAYLTFPHPVTGEMTELEAGLPDDMRGLLERLRDGSVRVGQKQVKS